MSETKEATSPVAPAPAESPLPVAEAAVSPEPVTQPQEAEAPRLDEWGKVRELALKQLDRFMSFEPKVLRGDDPDAIHDMRVASRRLQQVFDLLYPPVQTGELRKLRRRIRRCRRSLGEVRNCDVMIQRVERILASKRATHREEWTAVRHYLLERRSASFLKSLRKLSKVNLAVFYVHLKEYLAPDGAAPHPGHHTPRIVSANDLTSGQFYERVGQSLERVWDAFLSQIEQSHRDTRTPVIHGARIAAKRLRYLIEVLHAFEVPGSADTLAWLRRLQQHLGDWHDLEVLEQMMIDMVARAEFLRDHLEIAVGVEKLILKNRENKKDFEEKYFRMTQDSAELGRIKDWVTYVLASPSAAFATA